VTSQIPLSYSRLATFEACEAKFNYLYVAKTVVDTDNEFTIYGNRVHSELELYAKVKLGQESEDKLSELHPVRAASMWYPLVDRALQSPGTHYFEKQMAITKAKQPCDWFAIDVWLRGIADVLVVNNDVAYCLDWKTGKIKDDPTQLKLFAAMIFAHFPEVRRVKTCFVWLHHGDTTESEYSVNDLDNIWAELEPRFDRVQEAVELGVFKAKPSGLCRFCAARQICSDARI